MTQQKKSSYLRPEWSYLVDVEDITSEPLSMTIKASDEEMKDLARRLKVESLFDLESQFTIKRRPASHIFYLSGEVCARVVQQCAISLSPLEEVIRTDFEAWYIDEGQAVSLDKIKRERDCVGRAAEREILDEENDPEPVIDGHIDVAEVAAQYLSLALPDYPLSPDVVKDIPEVEQVAETSSVRKNPFEALKNWKATKSDDTK